MYNRKFYFTTFLIVLMIVLAACNGSTNNKEENKGNNDGNNEVTDQEASDYPEKEIEMIVPFDAGGSTDTTARLLADVISEYLPNKQSIVVSNKPGGSGAIGMNQLYNAKPDGYTIGFTPSGPLVSTPIISETEYTHDSFQPIIQVSSQPQILIVDADAPWDTLDEWLEFVEENPGEFTYSHPGIGLNAHLAMEAVNNAVGIETKGIPYDGAAPARTALLGGEVDGTISLSQNLLKLVESGDAKAILNTGSERVDSFKDTPTLKEKDFDVAIDVFNGVFAPKDIPDKIQDILHDAFKQALEDEQFIEKLNELGVEIVYSGPEKLQEITTDTFHLNESIMENIDLN